MNRINSCNSLIWNWRNVKNDLPKYTYFFSVGAKILQLFGIGILVSACSTVDLEQSYPESHVIQNTQQTSLGQLAKRLSANKKADQSGFYALTEGVEAFALRLAMAETAEKSIDLQYYLIKNDLSGQMLIHSLLQAADRGVRVRILLDDIFTQGYDAGMLALESHPNIQIRLFNPFANRKFRGLDFHRVAQVNRRLHNKSFTVDNQFTIIGGRNIATEYFAAHESMNFHDLDVLSVGPLVSEVSAMFDQYWNSRPAVPVTAVASNKGQDLALELQRMHERLAQTWQGAKNSDYGLAVLEDLESFSLHINQQFFWAPYTLVYDAPEKGLKSEAKNATNIVSALGEAISQAEHSLVIISPYFVPLKDGIRRLQALHDRGVAVTVITNSFKANNHSIVHAGYAPYRKRIIQTGAKLYEAKADTQVNDAERLKIGDSGATLHTKMFVVDNKAVFVGSFNFDPRSANLNTELGVIIYAENAADAALKSIRESLNDSTYEVVLTEDNKLQWLERSGNQMKEFSKEPGSSAWERFKLNILGLLPIRSQL